MSIAGFGKAVLALAGIAGTYGVMGTSMRADNPAAVYASSCSSISPSDYGPMSVSLRIFELKEIQHVYFSKQVNARFKQSSREGYDALASTLPGSTLHAVQLPLQLPQNSLPQDRQIQ